VTLYSARKENLKEKGGVWEGGESLSVSVRLKRWGDGNIRQGALIRNTTPTG